MGYATATDGQKNQLLPASTGKVYEGSAMENKVVDLARLVKTMQDCQQQSDRLRELQVQQVTAGLQLLSTQLQALCRLVVMEPDDALCGGVGPVGAGTSLTAGAGVPVGSAMSHHGVGDARRCGTDTGTPQLLLARADDLLTLSQRVQALEHLQEQSEAAAQKAADEQAQRNVAFEMRLLAAEAAADRTRALLAASAQQAREHERAAQEQQEHGQGLERRLAAVEAQLGTVMACVSAMHRKEADAAAECAARRQEQQQEEEERGQRWGQGRSCVTTWGSGGAAAVGGPVVHSSGPAGAHGGAVVGAAQQGLPVGTCGLQEGASAPSQPPAAAEEVMTETLAGMLQRVPPHVALSMLLQQQTSRDASHTEALLAMVQSLGLAHHALLAPLERLATLTVAPQQPPSAAATATAAGQPGAQASSTPTSQAPQHAQPGTVQLPAVPHISDMQPGSPCQVPAAATEVLLRAAPGQPAAAAVHATGMEPQQPTRIPVQPERLAAADAGPLGPSPPPSILSLSELRAPPVQELCPLPTDTFHARNSSPAARKGRSSSAQAVGISGPRHGQTRGPLLSSPARLTGSPPRALQQHRVPHGTPQRQGLVTTAASSAKGSAGCRSGSAQRPRGGCTTGPRSALKKAAVGAGSSQRRSARSPYARGAGRGLGSDEEGSRWGWLTEEEEEQVGATWCSARAAAVAALSGRVQTGAAAAAGERLEPGGQLPGVRMDSGALGHAVPDADEACVWAGSRGCERAEGGVRDPLGALEVAALLRSSIGRGTAGQRGSLGRGPRSASAELGVGDVRTAVPPKGGRATTPGHASAGSKASVTRAKKSVSLTLGAHKR